MRLRNYRIVHLPLSLVLYILGSTMSNLTFKRKVDAGIFVILLFICIPLLFFAKENSEIKEVDLSHSQLECIAYDNRYSGYFALDGQKFNMTGRYYKSCESLQKFFSGSKIHAKYLRENNALIEIIVDGKTLIEDSKTKMLYIALFFTIILFSIIRKPIHKIACKYV